MALERCGVFVEQNRVVRDGAMHFLDVFGGDFEGEGRPSTASLSAWAAAHSGWVKSDAKKADERTAMV